MPRHRFTRLLLASALLLAPTLPALGCGGAHGASEGSTLPTPVSSAQRLALESLVPPDASAMVRVDARAFFASPLLVHVEEQIASWFAETEHRADFEVARDLAHRTDELVVALSRGPEGSGDEMLLLVRGRFSPADLGVLGEDLEASEHAGHALRVEDSWGLAQVADDILAVGPTQLLHDACDRFDGRLPLSPASHPALVEALARAEYGQHTVTFGVVAPEGSGAASEDPMSAVETFDGYCDVVDGLRCEFGALVSGARRGSTAARLLAGRHRRDARPPRPGGCAGVGEDCALQRHVSHGAHARWWPW
ncbi:MAG: hypothetical protein IPG17_21390 [Sandaracinaceae bacterium]|nr:hypothetical protein [Sandaracinaceae bacterium]